MSCQMSVDSYVDSPLSAPITEVPQGAILRGLALKRGRAFFLLLLRQPGLFACHESLRLSVSICWRVLTIFLRHTKQRSTSDRDILLTLQLQEPRMTVPASHELIVVSCYTRFALP